MSEEMQLALEHTLKTMRELKEAKAEIERLRETNEMMLTDIRRTDVDMLAFKAEIKHYRKTLRDIVRQCNNPIHTCPAGMDRIIERVEEMAIDALGPKPAQPALAEEKKDDR